jgi:hypothetical protein
MNKSAIKELNELINEEYTIEIKLSQSVILDSYSEGELEESYYIPDFYAIKRYSKPESLKEDLRECLNFLMKDVVYYGSLEKYYKECFNYTDNDIVTLRHVNEDRMESTQEEVALWKEEKCNLYNEYVGFEIIINGAKIGADLVSKLIESEEYNVEQVAV